MAALPVSVFSSITEKLCCLIPSKSNGYRVGNNTVLKDNQVPKNFMKNETEKKKSEKKITLKLALRWMRKLLVAAT